MDLRASVEALSSPPSSFFIAHYSRSGPAASSCARGRRRDRGLARDEACTAVFAATSSTASGFAQKAGVSPKRSHAELVLAASARSGPRRSSTFAALRPRGPRPAQRTTSSSRATSSAITPLLRATSPTASACPSRSPRLARHPEVRANRPRRGRGAVDPPVRSSDETYFTAIQRVRSGWLYRFGRDALRRRYWFPVSRRTVEWVEARRNRRSSQASWSGRRAGQSSLARRGSS